VWRVAYWRPINSVLMLSKPKFIFVKMNSTYEYDKRLSGVSMKPQSKDRAAEIIPIIQKWKRFTDKKADIKS
jgi:hypothetical protein